MNNYKISDYNYIGSSIGNAYFSGVTYDQLWSCVLLAQSREELDFAISATIKLNELIEGKSANAQ